MAEKYTQEKFVAKAIIVHGDGRYDYGKSIYRNWTTPLCIVCNKCGNEFWQTPQNHLVGKGCPICGITKNADSLRMGKDEFVRRAKIIHKDENIDYSFVEYKNNRTPVLLYDHDLRPDGTEWGEFWQTPQVHLRGGMHKGKKRFRDCNYLTTAEVVIRFREKHPNENLDYSKVNYVNMHTKVCIIDHDLRPDGTEWGEFWQEPAVHLKGCGHPEKSIYNNSLKRFDTTETWVKKAKQLDIDDQYDLSYVCYKTSRTPVDIFCKKIGTDGKPHGFFKAIPDNFLQRKGCPKCGHQLSKAENEIFEYIKGMCPDVQQRHKGLLVGQQEIDIYIPSIRLAIEYNGLHWHSEEFNKDKNYHLEKTEECERKGIRLIHIFEDEWLQHRAIVLGKLKHIIGKSNSKRIYGRKCETREIYQDEAENFLNSNHIQGFACATVYIGGFHNNNLVGVMAFKEEGKKSGKWELTRYATDINCHCIGLGGKLFKHFINNYKFVVIKSFADRRWTSTIGENLYIKLGFKLTQILKPNYRYIIPGSQERHHKFNFRKQRLHKKYGLPLSMTEYEMTQELGFFRIWDCGLLRYEYEYPK